MYRVSVHDQMSLLIGFIILFSYHIEGEYRFYYTRGIIIQTIMIPSSNILMALNPAKVEDFVHRNAIHVI